MKRTLILAVDRDDDFGEKVKADTPIIGIDNVSDAALKFGAIDPEDSDVNSLFAAIKMYNELLEEGADVHIALLCGDKKVGHVSDAAIVEELEKVLEEVKPERAILVSDGSEDEYIYPIISSRIPIDSVRKVFVKQAPGLEGSLYILSKMLRDSSKKRRFLAPIGLLLMIIGIVYMALHIVMYYDTEDVSTLYNMTNNVIVFIIGLLIISYSYDLLDKIKKRYRHTINDIKSGNVMVIFSTVAVAIFTIGIITGILTVNALYDADFVYKSLVFASTFLWMLILSIVCFGFGIFVDSYVRRKKVLRSFLISTISLIALAFIIQGLIDLISSTLGYSIGGEALVAYEFIIGIAIGMCAAILQVSFKEFYDSKKAEETDTDDIPIMGTDILEDTG